MTKPTDRQVEAVARAICRVQINGGDPDQPAMRWNGLEAEPQEFPAWRDFMDEATAALTAVAEVGDEDDRDPYARHPKAIADNVAEIERLRAALEKITRQINNLRNAITAAAEVESNTWLCTNCGEKHSVTMRVCPQAAAAEVADDKWPKRFKAIDYIKTQEELDAYRIATENEAIERCARVVLRELSPEVGEEIATALRALKDNP